jgi:hypothetical protein
MAGRLILAERTHARRAMDITYQDDVGPHLERALAFRVRRQQRLHHLHEHDGRAFFWRVAIPGLVLFWASVIAAVYRLA